MERRVGGRKIGGRKEGGTVDIARLGGGDRNRNETQEKARRGGKAILLALIDFWENNVISVSLSTLTLRNTHTQTQTM